MPMDSTLALKLCAQPSGMNEEECVSLLRLLVSAQLDVKTGASLLSTWAERGETGVELAATVRFLKKTSVNVQLNQACLDLCGTGGSGLTRYNVSTTVAFVAAAAGVPVAKHGNRGSRRPNGSFDLLEALEIPYDLTPKSEAKLQLQSGLCFLFARTHHPDVGKVVPYRKAAGCRSIFNLAGPLANPAPIKHQLIGTVDEKTAQVMAKGLVELRTEGALVVWGEPGIDEISITGTTGFLKVNPQGITEGLWTTPCHPKLDYAALPGGDAPENAEIFHRLLGGKEIGPLLDMVCVSAGAVIDMWRKSPPAYAGPGQTLARELIASGQVRKTFEKHRSLAQSLSPTRL